MNSNDAPDVTLSELIGLFVVNHVNIKVKRRSDVERMLVRELVPTLGHFPAKTVHRSHLVPLIDTIAARGTKTAANRLLAHSRKMLNWAVERGHIEANPLVGVRPPTKEVSRDRILSVEEMCAFWAACEALGFPFGPLFLLLLVTGQRRGEVTQMRWSDLDGDTWIIPETKNGRVHQVPLSSLALSIINGIPRLGDYDWVFTTNGRNPVSGYSRAKDRIGVVDWHLHDLRRTAATGMAKLGVAPHIVEKVLNHSSGIISGVAAVYNRHGYEDEKRQALDLWATHLISIIDHAPTQIQKTGTG